MYTVKHNLVEDLFALFCAALFVSFGIYLFDSQSLMVGGVAGLALLAKHATGLGFSELFFIINLPFYWLAWSQIGPRFTINTFVSVATVAVLTEVLPNMVNISMVDPLFSAVFGGVLVGVGMLMLFRHNASLGGVGIMGFYLQQKFGIRAGVFQLCIDITIMLAALAYISWELVLISILAAVCLNMVISLNHKTQPKPEVEVPIIESELEEECLMQS